MPVFSSSPFRASWLMASAGLRGIAVALILALLWAAIYWATRLP